MQEVICLIKERKKSHNGDYWIIEDISEKKHYSIPVEYIRKEILIDNTYTFIKRYTGVKYHFTLLNTTYKIGEFYYFEVLEFTKGFNKRKELVDMIKLRTDEDEILEVRAFKWQKPGNFRGTHIRCEVIDYNNYGLPYVINRDYRHPIYEIGKQYSFEVVGKRVKRNDKSNLTITVFDIKGNDGVLYETTLLAGQLLQKELPETVHCEVLDITNNIRLRQVITTDPYFVSIDDIIKDKNLIRTYFSNIFSTESNLSLDHNKLIDQYSSKSAFWVFTYCNKILPKLFRDSVKRLDYKATIELNEIMLHCEEWIVKRGIITSFPTEDAKKRTLHRAETQIVKCKLLKNILPLFLKAEFSGQIQSMIIEELYFTLSLGNLDLIDEVAFVNRVKDLLKTSEIDSYYLKSLEKLINIKKLSFVSEAKEDFKFNDVVNFDIKDNLRRNKFFTWSYCQFIINIKLDYSFKARLLLCNILRNYFYVVSDMQTKSKLLYNAYYFLNNIENPIEHRLFDFKSKLVVNLNILNNNPNVPIERKKEWNVINESIRNHSTVAVDVLKRLDSGFRINFGGIEGYLPINHITDSYLKGYLFDIVDFKITVKCLAVSEEFGIFIAKQLDKDDPSYLSINNHKPASLKKGDIVDGYVKRIESYGIFLSTIYGDGLLHINNISGHIWDLSRLSKHFKVKQHVKCVFINLSADSKLEFSLSDLADTALHDEYDDFIFKVSIDDEEDLNGSEFDKHFDDLEVANDNVHYQLEKAYCFEQSALLQDSIAMKINSLRLAKYFYSKAFNARSYLINIYTDYFAVLLMLQDIVENYNLEKLEKLQSDVRKIRDRINPKTLENFPDSERLIYFLEILNLFNDKSDQGYEKLYNYIKIYSKSEENSILKTIAKITLSNNLIISETDDHNEYCRKNLKHINLYIEHGILSLKEDESERLKREELEKVNYWKGKISGNENQTLEFKTTFKTPVLDSQREQKLIKLKNIPNQTDDIKREISKINGDLASKGIIHSAMKTLAAFANSSGGTLLIGVTDDKVIYGLENEYSQLKQQDRDGFGKQFDDTIVTYFGESFAALLDKEFIKFPEGDVLVINVTPSIDEVFLLKDEEGKQSEQLFIRNLSSSRLLDGIELAKFIKTKYLQTIKQSLDQDK